MELLGTSLDLRTHTRLTGELSSSSFNDLLSHTCTVHSSHGEVLLLIRLVSGGQSVTTDTPGGLSYLMCGDIVC